MPQDGADETERRAPHAGEADLVRILTKLSNLVGRPFFSHFAERYDLTRNDVSLLMTLAEMGEAAAHELCRASGMHPMNVSRSVARLRRQGRITERTDPANRRRKILALTAAGADVDAHLRPHVKAMGAFLCTSLTELEADVLTKLLRRLIERLAPLDLNSPALLDLGAMEQQVTADVEASAEAAPARKRKPQRGAARVPASSRITSPLR
jgi:DNA-binding MarR family transcriptional regulator